MNNTEYLKEEFKKAVLKVRPDALFCETNIHGDVNVGLPETKDIANPLVAYFNGDNVGGQYAVWYHGWDCHTTLDAFIVDFKNRYGKDKEEPKKTTEYLKEEFKKAVLDVRPDSIVTDSCRDGVSVAKPNASYDDRYIAWLDIDEEEEGMYQVWNGLDWDKYHTLEQFKSNFIGHYGCTTKPKEAHEDTVIGMPIDDVHDTSNYHGVKGTYEPINVMEYAHEQFLKRGLGADEALNLAIAIKYLLRVGTKDYAQKEIFKALNFTCRALYGKWLHKDFVAKMLND